MQATEAAVIESPAMATSQRRGRELRRAILGALVELAPPGSKRVSLADLAKRLDRRAPTIAYHVGKMARDGLIDSRPGPGGGLVLTATGRQQYDALG